MPIEETPFAFMPKVGDGISWIIQKVIQSLSNWGVGITDLQAKIMTLLLIGIFIYILISILNITRKPLKWGLVILSAFLLISVFLSILTS